MRKFIIIIFCVLTTPCFAQLGAIDSITTALQNEKRDTSRVMLLSVLSSLYTFSKPDTAMFLAQKGLALSKQLGFKKGEATSLNTVGTIFAMTADYPKALQLQLEALKIAETIHEDVLMSRIYAEIGFVYFSEGDYQEDLSYQLKSLMVAEQGQNKRRIETGSLNVGDSYEKLNMLDSARYFTNKGYELAVELNDADGIGTALDNLGNIYSKMHQDAIAIDYHRADVPYFKQSEDDEALCETYLAMAKLFQGTFHSDSCVYYAKLSLALSRKAGFTSNAMQACVFLTDCYKSTHNIDSAFVYQSTAISAKDSLFSEQKAKALQNMIFQENIRQQEISEQKKEDQEELKRNIQRAGIAVFIPIFFLFVLLLSKTKVKSRAVEFLAIVGLLLFFEFITDLLYPFISNWTNESPVWETLIFVILAACLEPVSHRLEHWIKSKLVHKTLH